MTAIDIETLYTLVTEAIRRAEVLEDLHAPGARDAYRDVSRLEERIAGLVPPTRAEGRIARRGAIAAAISGEEFHRAVELVARFKAEQDIDCDLASDLDTLGSKAEAAADIGKAALADEVLPEGGSDFFRAITQELKNSGRFTIPDLGTFIVQEKKSSRRSGSRRGEPHMGNDERTIQFEPSLALKKAI